MKQDIHPHHGWYSSATQAATKPTLVWPTATTRSPLRRRRLPATKAVPPPSLGP